MKLKAVAFDVGGGLQGSVSGIKRGCICRASSDPRFGCNSSDFSISLYCYLPLMVNDCMPLFRALGV